MLKKFMTNFGQVLDTNRFALFITPPTSMQRLPLTRQIAQSGGLLQVTGQSVPQYADNQTSPVTDPVLAGFLCHRTQLPGVGIETTGVELGIGYDRHSPYLGNANEPVECSFYVAGPRNTQSRVLEFFEEWTAKIYRQQENPNGPWNIGYYDDIVGTVDIRVYRRDTTDAPVYLVKLSEAWPVTVSPINLSWDAAEPMRLSVTFNYAMWERVPLTDTQLGVLANSGVPPSQ